MSRDDKYREEKESRIYRDVGMTYYFIWDG